MSTPEPAPFCARFEPCGNCHRCTPPPPPILCPEGHDQSAGRWCGICGQLGSHHTPRHDEFVCCEPLVYRYDPPRGDTVTEPDTTTETRQRTTVEEALAAWEANGPTSLTVALMADALYGVRDALEADATTEPHDVKLHVGTGTVVCTCGAYFETERFGVTMPRSAVSLWAQHVRRTTTTTRTIEGDDQ